VRPSRSEVSKYLEAEFCNPRNTRTVKDPSEEAVELLIIREDLVVDSSELNLRGPFAKHRVYLLLEATILRWRLLARYD